MHYFIDGYNLFFRMLRAGDDLQVQRGRFIQELSSKIQFLEIDATLVFDAHYQDGEGSRGHLNSVEVVYTPTGVSADELIIAKLKTIKNPRLETVVTSDKKLAWQARRKMAQSQSVEDFMAWLNRRCVNKKRSISQKQQNTLQSITAIQPPPSTSPPPPTEISHKEGSMEYYEELFEKRVAEEALSKPLKQSKKKKKTLKAKNPPPEKVEKAYKSELDRWLDLFS